MLFLVISLLRWTKVEGCDNGALASMYRADSVVPAGGSFNLTCEFICLKPHHVAQLWRMTEHGDKECLLNITQSFPNAILALRISSATKADTGYYYCMTQLADTISPQLSIEIADDLTTSPLTTHSSPQPDCSQQHRGAAGLLGQVWFWILLAKAFILLLNLGILSVKYKRG